MRWLATGATSELELAAHEHEPLRVVASRTPTRVVMRRLPELRFEWADATDGARPRLEAWDARGEWLPAMERKFTAPAFGPLPLRAVVQRGDGSSFVLRLAPVTVSPGMDPAIRVALTPDQRATLRAAAGG